MDAPSLAGFADIIPARLAAVGHELANHVAVAQSDTQNMSPEQMVLAGAAILAVFYFALRPALKKKKPDPIQKQPQLSLAQQRKVEKQMESLLVELSNMARQVGAQIDTRSAKLQQLIEDADQRIARLDSQESRPARAVPDPLAEPDIAMDRPLPAREAPALPDEHRQVLELAERGKDAESIAAELDRPRGEIELILALTRDTSK